MMDEDDIVGVPLSEDDEPGEDEDEELEEDSDEVE
jgi:hypothetical protein